MLGLLFDPEDGGSSSSQTLVNLYQVTQHYITEESTVHLLKALLHSSELFYWIRCIKFLFESSISKIKDDFISCNNFVLLPVKSLTKALIIYSALNDY
jgi:hypothetical protein